PFDLLAIDSEHSTFPSFPRPDCHGPSLLMWSRKLMQLDARSRAPATNGPHPRAGPQKWVICLRCRAETSAAQTQALNQSLITRLVLALHIVEQATALRHHLDQPTPRMIVLGVGFEVIGQVGDALGKHSHLDF